jgi:hypothetical protein
MVIFPFTFLRCAQLQIPRWSWSGSDSKGHGLNLQTPNNIIAHIPWDPNIPGFPFGLMPTMAEPNSSGSSEDCSGESLLWQRAVAWQSLRSLHGRPAPKSAWFLRLKVALKIIRVSTSGSKQNQTGPNPVLSQSRKSVIVILGRCTSDSILHVWGSPCRNFRDSNPDPPWDSLGVHA